MNINFYGSTEGCTGYATHSRELIKALKQIGVAIDYGTESYNSPCLAITMPEAWSVRSGNRHKPFIPFLVSEGTRLSEGWVHYCNADYVSKILVPSTHVRDVAIASGVTKPIIIAPHGVDTDLFNPDCGKVKDLEAKPTFKFFMHGGWGQGIKDRKGFQYALKAFDQEFKETENVELYIKINMVYNPNLNIQEEIRKLGIKPSGKIIIMTQELPYEKLPKVYRSMDCFVAPSMADAFNIPVLESMACGVPAITTNYSGMTDFVNESNGWLIPIEKMIKSEGQPHYIYENAEWAVPDVAQLRKLMRYAYEHPDECKTRGLKARETALKFTWTNTAKIVKEAFDEKI